jgi:hypothetical protein
MSSWRDSLPRVAGELARAAWRRDGREMRRQLRRVANRLPLVAEMRSPHRELREAAREVAMVFGGVVALLAVWGFVIALPYFVPGVAL